MIKLTYKGLPVEFDSVEEARKFIDGEEEKVVVKAPKQAFKKTRKGTTWNHWLEEEIKVICEAIDAGEKDYQITKYGVLRDRHSQQGIRQMVVKVKGNTTHSVSPVVATKISEWNRTRSRTLIPRHG